MIPPINSSSACIVQQNSEIDILPDEIFATEISKYLDLKDILSCKSICQRFYTVMKDNTIWKHRFFCDFPGVTKPIYDYESTYRHLYTHLRKGIYSLFALHGAQGSKLFSIAMSGSACFTGHERGKITVWNLDFKELITQDTGVDANITSFAVREKKPLFFGCSDGTIVIWDIDSATPLAKLQAHEKEVSSLLFVDDNTLCSGSYDGTIKFWKIDSQECIETIFNQNAILSLAVLDHWLFSSDYDGEIKVWDIDSKQCTRLENHKEYDRINVPQLIVIDDGKLVTAACDSKRVKTWDNKFTRHWENRARVWDKNLEKWKDFSYDLPHDLPPASLATIGPMLFTGFKGGGIHATNITSPQEDSIILSQLPNDVDFLAGSNGCKLAVGCKEDGNIQVLDFTANDETVLQEIADQFLVEDPKSLQQACERFSQMPVTIKDKVYQWIRQNSRTPDVTDAIASIENEKKFLSCQLQSFKERCKRFISEEKLQSYGEFAEEKKLKQEIQKLEDSLKSAEFGEELFKKSSEREKNQAILALLFA